MFHYVVEDNKDTLEKSLQPLGFRSSEREKAQLLCNSHSSVHSSIITYAKKCCDNLQVYKQTDG